MPLDYTDTVIADLSARLRASEQDRERLFAAGMHAASVMALAYDAVSKGLYDEALLHLGANEARIRALLGAE